MCKFSDDQNSAIKLQIEQFEKYLMSQTVV
jgi:hypothetical protein